MHLKYLYMLGNNDFVFHRGKTELEDYTYVCKTKTLSKDSQ